MNFDAILLTVLQSLGLSTGDIVLRPPLAILYCKEVNRRLRGLDMHPKLILQRLMELDPASCSLAPRSH